MKSILIRVVNRKTWKSKNITMKTDASLEDIANYIKDIVKTLSLQEEEVDTTKD